MFKTVTAGLLLLAGAAFVVAPTGAARPGITVSNRLTPAKNARVLVFTMTPKTTWAGPYTWRTSLNGDTLTEPEITQYAIGSIVAGTAPEDSLTAILLTPAQIDKMFGRTRSITDTVFQAFPTCAEYRVTVFPATVKGVVKRDSLTKKVWVCRTFTRGELAFRDSFPQGSGRIALCGSHGYKIDSATADTIVRDQQKALGPGATTLDTLNVRQRWALVLAGPDSVRLPSSGVDTISVPVGYRFHLGLLLRNRYTGAVSIGDGDLMRCESARLSYESERGT